jgi:hypothetical protein
LAEPRRIAAQPRRLRASVQLHAQADALGGRLAARDVHQLVQHVAHAQRRVRQREQRRGAARLARLAPLGEVQQLVDDCQQRVGGCQAAAQILRVVRRQLVALQHCRGEAHNSVERRAQLVRDAGEEGALQRERGIRVRACGGGGGAQQRAVRARAQQHGADALGVLAQRSGGGRLRARGRVQPQAAHHIAAAAQQAN